jgi:farnesyl-diphosphate farnesyltransferase
MFPIAGRSNEADTIRRRAAAKKLKPMPDATNDLLTCLLRDVSRSFYLTMRVLPAAVRPQIGLAYLLARTTDTIADTEVVPVAERLGALERLQARILGTGHPALDFSQFARANEAAAASDQALAGNHQKGVAVHSSTTEPERLLLERVEEALGVLHNFPPQDQQRIREVLATITSGQALDLQRFAGASEQSIFALPSDLELDDYTYRVAGCVGEFWTKICRAHLFPNANLDDAALLANGVRFGKGLQLVNILRDLPRDLRLGRCYLPMDQLVQAGLRPSDLLQPTNRARFLPLVQFYLDRAEAHLAAGWTYTNSLPYRCARVRLACAWPILIGLRTLAKMRSANLLEPAVRVKTSRPEVRQIILRSLIAYPLPGRWRKLFDAAKNSSV